VARILWKFANKGLPTPAGTGLLKKAAAAGHGLLYLLILLQPISGWAMSSAANFPVTFFGWFQFPAIVSTNHALHESLADVHEALFYVLVTVAALHVVAALYHHFILKDDVLRRMSPFRRR
jgi:cytochrome b561